MPAAWRINFEEACIVTPALRIDARFEPRIQRDEPMSRHTSWHVGGPADVFFTPKDRADLLAFLEVLPTGTPLFWLGLGSNLLVRDGGIRGVVIDTTGLDQLESIDATTLYADAGVPCARIARRCISLELGPAEFFAGIPGCLGGALTMNAGAFGGETWPRVRAVDVCDARGRERRRDAREYSYSYRRIVPPVPGEFFLGAVLEFEHRPGLTDDALRDLIARRKESQPIGEWSCGSTFTNPKGDHAARLIEAAGLKGTRIGDVMVSPKHANFLVNVDAAKAADVERLVALIQQEVKRQFGVTLTPEFRVVGEAS
ncbi:MAG TPA: UDP-N-acetylmuramate dehydrogenase [Steroidobacteraceae bacterium]|nr:UDP-N-acetylmuramate dehydrogenase [Steroidobacteraceae bacterium]